MYLPSSFVTLSPGWVPKKERTEEKTSRAKNFNDSKSAEQIKPMNGLAPFHYLSSSSDYPRLFGSSAE